MAILPSFQEEEPVQNETSAFRRVFFRPAMLIVLLWVIQIVQFMIPLVYLGIMPREVNGLPGIITAPLIHGSIGHLASNSVPLFVLTAMMLFFYKRIALQAIAIIWILTGIAVWMLAKPAWHIGASGVIYGLVTFIFWSGVFRRSLRSLILAAIIALLYSGMVLGVLPDNSKPVSWESHLFGAIVGIFVAFYFRNDREEAEKPPVVAQEEETKDYYFPRDLFER